MPNEQQIILGEICKVFHLLLKEEGYRGLVAIEPIDGSVGTCVFNETCSKKLFENVHDQVCKKIEEIEDIENKNTAKVHVTNLMHFFRKNY